LHTIERTLELIASAGTTYDEIINTIIQPNFHLKPELISELAISFLTNRVKVQHALDNNYFLYYFVRSVKNQIHSNTSGFHKNTRIKEYTQDFNYEMIDESDIEIKKEKEAKYITIDKIYVKIPKTYFQEFLFQEYFTFNKTFRQIAKENEISHTLVFHEVSKVKKQLQQMIGNPDIK
jgi:hypothetical protein